MATCRHCHAALEARNRRCPTCYRGKGARIWVRLDTEWHDRFTALAASRHMTASQFLREGVRVIVTKLERPTPRA